VGEIDFNKLAKEGWAEVKGEVEATFNSGEGWEWKAVKRRTRKAPSYST